MAPFVGDGDDLPWWSGLSPAELASWEAEQPGGCDERAVPELPAEWVEDVHTADRVDADQLVPCACACCGAPTPVVSDLPESTRAHVADTELAFTFGRQWALAQQHTAAAWRAAATLHARVLASRGVASAEHVGSDLALLMNVHPRTGQSVLVTAVAACQQVPELAGLVLAGELGVRHVDALLREAAKWTSDEDQAATVIRLTLDGCASRLAKYGWPTPAELRKRLAKVAILQDLQALTTAKQNVAERRGASLFQTGIGKACLSIEGPELMMLQAYRAIETRAHAMGRLPGDERTLQQRMHDAALELLCVDVDGGESTVPTTGLHGEPITLTVRGVQIVVLVPYSVLEGGDLELAEIDGYGPLLPSTARELADQADSFRRVVIDAGSGHLITVDDAIPTRRRRTTEASRQAVTEPERDEPSSAPADEPDDAPDSDPDDDPGGGPGGAPDSEDTPPAAPAPSSGRTAPEPDPEIEEQAEGSSSLLSGRPLGTKAPDVDRAPWVGPPDEPPRVVVENDTPCPSPLDPATLALLRALVAKPVHVPDLGTDRYRTPGRLRRTLIYRDRTCTFPGCTVPGEYVDIDHRDEWPRGGTHEGNLHCLCRRHHRAKQFYFAAVTLDRTAGDTLWTTRDGRTYRRPRPTF